MNRTLRLAISPRGRGFILATWAFSQLYAPLAAGEPVPAPGFTKLSQSPARRQHEEPDKTVRLNQFNATWPDVLNSLAEQSGSTLVLHDPPPGRFTRADYREYTRSEAVAILNRDLEPKGFRILENDDFLVVLSERTMRKQYRPAVVSPEDASGRPIAPPAAPEQAFQGYQRKFDQIRPVGGEELQSLPEPRSFPNPHPFAETANSLEESNQPQVELGPPVTLSVRVGRNSATTVAKALHESFGLRSELTDAGPSGLPSFRVHASEAGERDLQQVSFEVEIDTARDELLVTAPRARATAVADILRTLEQSGNDRLRPVRILPATKGQLQLADELSPILAQVTQNGPVSPNQPNQPNLNPNGQPNQAEPGERREAVISGDLPGLIGNLRGEVSIEAVPDLGVLVIRGNDQDVQSVLQVIQTLESLSAGQQPVIELLGLEHVDSAALSQLLESVYGRLATVRNRGTEAPSRVAVIPIVKPNAVLIIAPEGEMDAVLDLATQLDQPVEPATEFQVFRLKSALATNAATTIESFYNERAGLGTRVNVIADIRTNSLVVAARARDLAEIAALVRRIDKDESAWVNQIKVYPLQSASAEELAEVINAAIQSVINPTATQQQGGLAGGGGLGGAGGAAAQELNAARSAVLEFLDASGDAPQLRRSGLLADIRVTADPRTNSLLVTAGEQSLPLIESLIRQLDRPAAAVSEIKVFGLENSDAASVVELLDGLFATEQQGNNQTATPGIQLAGAADPGSSLIPLRFATDIRTNSVIATGSADALRIVEAVLLRLDESDIRQRETTVIKLKNSYAPDVAAALQQLVTSQRELLTISENLVSNIELLEREIIVIPEPVTNSLLISATPRYYEQVIAIVTKLDQAPPQVIIQAMLVEVTLDNTDEFGIELGFQDSTLFDRSITTINQLLNVTTTAPNGTQTTTQQVVSQSGTPGFNFNNAPLGNNTAAGPGSIGTQGLGNFGLGRTNADLGYGGFVFSASSANVSVLLRALSAKRTVQVLSRPQIRTLDNQLAQIQVGQNVPIVTGYVVTNGLATPTTERDNAGLILTVIPRISPDGNVVMEVAAERSEYTGAGVPIFVDANTGNAIESPIKDITTARATVSVPTGQTIVLGGIITRSDDTLERKVPYLGDIPYLGALFRFDSTSTVRRELLVFLTPRVIYTDGDSELIKQVEADRLHFIEHEAESMHGPLYGVPPAGPVLPPGQVPPVLMQNPAGLDGFPVDQVPPGVEILPGLPAEACPPGVYPPGTLFDDEPVDGFPLQNRSPGVVPPGPSMQQYPPVAPPAGMGEAVRPTGGAVAGGRLAGKEPPVPATPKKKSLLPSLR